MQSLFTRYDWDDMTFDSPWMQQPQTNASTASAAAAAPKQQQQQFHNNPNVAGQLIEENRQLREMLERQTQYNLRLQAENTGIRSGFSPSSFSSSTTTQQLEQVNQLIYTLRKELESLNGIKLEKKIRKTVLGLYYPMYIGLGLIFLVFILLIVHMSMRKTIQV